MVTLTVTGNSMNSSTSQTVTAKYVASNPTTLSITPTTTGEITNIAYTVGGGAAPYSLKVTWGDGKITTQTLLASGSSTTSHTYGVVGTFNGSVYVIDSGVNGNLQTSATRTFTATTSLATVSGLVTRANGTTPVSSAIVSLLTSPTATTAVTAAVTNSSGNYSLLNVPSGTYYIKVTKSGLTFPITGPITVTGSMTIPVIKSTT